MPVPPNESMNPKTAFTKAMVPIRNVVANIKDKKKCFDLMMATIVFCLTAIELISLHYQTHSATIPQQYWDYYALNQYPLLATISTWLVALFFLLKILRYNSCWDTKIITILYFLLQTINILATVTKFGSPLYFTVVYPLLLVSIIVLIITKAVRWCISK